MNAVELIQRKRDQGVLTHDEIAWLIRSYTSGAVTDYQMASMSMAVFLNGLEPSELVEWTRAMLHSGNVLDFSDITLPKVDKHSTGGVGDKVSIPLAPMVAACGVAIPMMSGRGLGHTGGTLDKLESIPGFTTALDPGRFREVLDSCGLVLAGQSETVVPADRKLYALRDATGTVESIPLISSSIMSKKLAEDLDGLVLDVKVGSGAFMKTRERARELAETMVGIGNAYEVKTVALLTAMEEPLGNEVGNANEVAESIAVLRGEGPSDLVEVTLALGIEMLSLAGIETDPDRARTMLEATRTSGKALEVFARVIEAQGGDPRVTDDPGLILPRSPHRTDVTATEAGFVQGLDALKVGLAAMRLGAGRERMEDTIDPAVGITVLAKPGTEVEAGQPILRLSYRHPARLEEALSVLDGAIDIGDEKPDSKPLILERVE
ncbi:MAG TPA: thymidine phosphorylase [Acidimicrobiia bacterium]|nr:thymidine phosphorylase [Acidimicrobiia bacterium]